jgi:hypothetical protein
MRRLLLCLVASAIAALVFVAAAAADGGPLSVSAGGDGIVHGTARYIPVVDSTSGDTELLATSTKDGRELNQLSLVGPWGLPWLASGAEGLSHDGRILVLAETSGLGTSPSLFELVDAKRMRILRTISLRGYFSFDALSPDGSRLYLIQYVAGNGGDFQDYVVRAYDVRRQRLLPGKIVDRKEKEESMAGSPVTRVTSADGRWVYTLYAKPSGGMFVHALDTVRATAHCIDLPSAPNHAALQGPTLSLRDHTLAVNLRDGRPWLDISLATWRVSHARAARFPWAWVGAGIGGGLALLAAGALRVRRRRREEVEEHAREELALAERHVVV